MSLSDDTEAGDQGERSRLGLGSPRVSGSGQVDTEEGEAIKAEAETKPVVRETGANTVKSGEKRIIKNCERGPVSRVTILG